jgi:2-polyprenyl-6-methoxyphenol hydroxylase-like FAD-dependent oxidoreductase
MQSVVADVAIVGGGPVGCVAALACAKQGAEVVVLEARLEAARRLAGELLHPPAVQMLDRLGVDLGRAVPEHARAFGFAVFPEDGSDPIQLSYGEGELSFCCGHYDLVTALREAVRSHPRIRLLAPARAEAVEGQRVRFTLAGRPGTLRAPQIVGADGHSSVALRQFASHPRPKAISLSAGVLLKNAELPFEGFCHVFLGGPGPVLVFRIAPRLLRAWIDVPAQGKWTAALLEKAYGPAIPGSLRASFRSALAEDPIAWGANRQRPRRHYGRDGLALVGDALGQLHPLTAAGLTLGFLDVECLAASRSFASYRTSRRLETHAAETLADVLYGALGGDDSSAAAMRQAIYWLWRTDAGDGCRSMRLLGCLETDPRVLRELLLKVVARAAKGVLGKAPRISEWPDLIQTIGGLGHWLKWPLVTRLRRIA